VKKKTSAKMLKVQQKHFEAVNALASIPINQKVKYCTHCSKPISSEYPHCECVAFHQLGFNIKLADAELGSI
jgi:hypothetical protein